MIFKRRLFTILLVFNLNISLETNAETLVIVDDGYCPFMCEDNDSPGIYMELLQKIFTGSPHLIEQQILPIKRAIHLAKTSNHQHSPMYIVVGAEGTSGHQLSKTDPISYHEVCYFTAQQNPWRYTGINSPAAHIGLIKGYEYKQYADYIFRTNNPNTISWIVGSQPTLKLMRQTAAQRIDVFVDIRAHSEIMQIKHNLQNSIINAGCSETPYPISLLLPNQHPLTEQLVAQINKSLKAFRRSGQLHTIFQRYNMPLIIPK